MMDDETGVSISSRNMDDEERIRQAFQTTTMSPDQARWLYHRCKGIIPLAEAAYKLWNAGCFTHLENAVSSLIDALLVGSFDRSGN